MKIKLASAKLKYFYAVLIFLLTASSAFSQSDQPFSINTSPLPAPTGFVNDYAGVIDAQTKQQLEQRITNFKNSTNPPVELAVAIVRTTGERPIFDYSLAVARGWGIGSKADDNPSALLFIAIDDRKYFTQVSKDLEDELPDGLVGQLQRQNLVPAFRQQNYSKGVSDTIDAYIRTIEARASGAPAPSPTAEATGQNEGRRNNSSIGGTGCCLIIVFILMLIIFSRSGRGGRGGRGGWGGGGFGGGGSALPWIIGSIIANSASSRGGSSGDWGGGFGGGDSGGGWGGFGGGGDFGGGGAGGDW